MATGNDSRIIDLLTTTVLLIVWMDVAMMVQSAKLMEIEMLHAHYS